MLDITIILLLPNYIWTEIFNSQWITQNQKKGLVNKQKIKFLKKITRTDSKLAA
ncbi:MAG TPA: hypothetical protein VMS35_00880 [Nitrososphaeraceae archaeon]|nr:hypothetical protein [Nitrososphaeraceae archaeon]